MKIQQLGFFSKAIINALVFDSIRLCFTASNFLSLVASYVIVPRTDKLFNIVGDNAILTCIVVVHAATYNTFSFS